MTLENCWHINHLVARDGTLKKIDELEVAIVIIQVDKQEKDTQTVY